MSSRLPIDTEREVWYYVDVRPVRGCFFLQSMPTAYQAHTIAFGETAPRGNTRTKVPPTGLTTVGIVVLRGAVLLWRNYFQRMTTFNCNRHTTTPLILGTATWERGTRSL